jgi:hypothetical protein
VLIDLKLFEVGALQLLQCFQYFNINGSLKVFFVDFFFNGIVLVADTMAG